LAVALLIIIGLWAAHRVRAKVLTRRVSERLQTQQLERLRIARELHDTLLQGVSSLTLMVHNAISKVDREHPVVPLLTDGLKQAEAVIAEGRARVARLRVNVEAGDVLIDELGILGIEMTAGSPTRFTLTVHGPARPLKTQVADECRGIAREAIWNAVQHANAARITLVIDFGRRHFTLQVGDDGCGVPQHVLAGGGIQGHWGLPGMGERAAAIGGRLEIQTRKGTQVALRVPARLAYTRPNR
jgi:signal transduction histidine kinase